MVEGEPDTKCNIKCDVKDEQLNGCGSKELELAHIGLKGKTLDPEQGSYVQADFEKAIELSEYGKFHYFLLAVCGFVSTSEEMDVISMSFILPSAQCDLKLDTQAKGWLNSIIFIGMMAGAYAWGSIADALGRRKVLIAISFMNALCIVASSFSQTYELFMFFRFLNGAALGGSGPVIWSYFAEFQPKSKRGSMLSFMAAFWTLGNLFVAGLAWLIIPRQMGFTSSSFTYNSWRIFLLICAIPSFVVTGLLLLLPESPKYLLSSGRYEEALEIFRKIYVINTGKPRETYMVKELILDDFQESNSVKAEVEEKSKCKIMLGDIVENSRQLFITPILRFTIISIVINFTFHIGYYGLMMWFPELFNRFDEFHRDQPNIVASICQVTDYVVSKGSHSVENVCSDKIGESVFMESLITVASAIPANIIAVLGMDRLGRKFFLVFSTFSSGLCSVGLYFVYNKYQNLIVSAIFSGAISCGNAALDCLITEVFPTQLRATGIAISMVAARLGGIIGNIVIAQLLDMYCPAPTFIVAALLIGKLTMHNDSINYYHIARLFKSQLLISCIQNKHQDDLVDESLNFLKALKHVNPEKLTQLSKRFVTPLPSQSQNIGPSFPGTQEFFRDFILNAFNPIFYTHLENCFVHEIMELNNSQFANSEIEDSETMVDEQTQQNFVTCLATLRLLAKVLGFLVSLPYRFEFNTTKEIVATQVEIRSMILPSLNLQICLHNAIFEGKLTLTIPWVVKYLAMMDIVSLRLPYYKQILEILYYIYHGVNKANFSASDCLISQQAAMLLKSCLCWLFELPNFPKDFCDAWQKTCKIKELKNLKQMEKLLFEKKRNSHSVDCSVPVKCSLDKLDIITDRIMRMCCPRTESTLSVFHGNGTNLNVNSNKHITPVTSQLKQTGSTNIRAKHLELQLEEAFFHGQPASTRKTIDFVSERVASTCVKHICNTLLASSREANLNSFRKILKQRQIENDPDEKNEPSASYINEFKASFVSDMNTLANNVSRDLKEQCEKTIPTICEMRVATSIESLLAEDSLTAVKDMCIKIATRMATERINQWIQSHIVGGSLFIKDMELEINRFFRNNSPVRTKQEKNHNMDAPSPAAVVDELRGLIWEIMDNNGTGLTVSSTLNVLDNLYLTFSQRNDLLPIPQKVLFHLSIDFTLFLVSYRTDLFTPELQDKLIQIWSLSSLRSDKDDSPLHRLMCSRNIMLLAQPENNAIWSVFGKFLKRLLETKILDIDSLSNQCVALFREDWPVPLLKLLSKCLTEAIDDYKITDEATEKVKYLLDWVAETYHEIEFCDDYDL